MAWQCIAQAVNEVGGAAKVPKRRKKNWSDLKLQSKKRVVFSLHGLQYLRSANAAILLLANYYFIGHRCIGIINMRGSKLFHNV